MATDKEKQEEIERQKAIWKAAKEGSKIAKKMIAKNSKGGKK